MCALRRRFEKQTKAFLPALYSAACRLMSGPVEVEAAVIEVYRRAYRAFQKHTDAGLLKRWLFALLWQVCLDAWRRQHADGIPSARPSFSSLQASLTPRQHTTLDLSSQEDRASVRQAIENLPIALRLVVLLVDIEGFSYQDTAAIVGCPVDLVAARLSRARQRLRGQLHDLVQPVISHPEKGGC